MTRLDALRAIYDRLARTSLSVSCGVTALAARDTIESAKARADRALYEAKRQGRGRWVEVQVEV